MFVETSETPDPALAPLAQALAADVPATVVRTDAQPSSKLIIDNMTETSRMAEKFALQRIDAAVERLQKLRELVQSKCRANIDSTIEFVRLVEDGLREVERLEGQSDKIADAAIST